MVISPLSQLITMRLKDDNFLIWKYQIENVVRVMVLKVSCLEQSNSRLPTPRSSVDFLASIFNRSAFLPHVVGCYVLQESNVDVKKDGMTIRDYLTKMKNYCDLLATASHKISIRSYTCYNSSPSLQYVTSTLIAHEGRIAHKISSNDLSGRGRGELKEESSLNVNYAINLVILFIIASIGSGARNGAFGSISSVGNVNLTEYDAQEDQDYSKWKEWLPLRRCSKLLLIPRFRATNHVTHDLGNLNSGA
ncbi:hypothetical protein AAG906_015059 [Vitis piasezkii]